MADISSLEGINSGDADKLCRAGVRTVEEFLAQIANHGYTLLSIRTGIKPERLIELTPPKHLSITFLTDSWLEGLAARVLEEAPPDDPWLRRCGFGLRRRARSLRGNWLGWEKNLPLFFFMAGLLLILALALRASGGLRWLPSPVGLKEQTLVTADNMEAGRVLKGDDLFPALLPPESDYFKPDDQLDGLIMARSKAGQTPLRFGDVLRPQLVAARDIQANAVIRRADVTLAWTTYQPGAALSLEEVCGRQALQAIRKDGAVLSRLVNSDPKAPAALPCE